MVPQEPPYASTGVRGDRVNRPKSKNYSQQVMIAGTQPTDRNDSEFAETLA
jgi:hypothetical protein